MQITRRRAGMGALAAIGLTALFAPGPRAALSARDIVEIRRRVTPSLKAALARRDLELGAAAFIRIFKEEQTLELWLARGDGFALFKAYEICAFSGDLGPKLKEGDRQAPEGFYAVGREALNPHSSYHLSFNLGFPNAYDRGRGRTGSHLMVHGDCLSIGCYAMTDPAIEEIYLVVEAALDAGQAAVPVHAFPFRMTAARMDEAADNPWIGFWRNLKTGYDAFEATSRPPAVSVVDGAYAFQAE